MNFISISNMVRMCIKNHALPGKWMIKRYLYWSNPIKVPQSTLYETSELAAHMERWLFITCCQVNTLYSVLSGSFLGERRDRRVTEQRSEFVYHIYEFTSINSVFPRYWESILPCWMEAMERLLVERKLFIESYQLPAIPLKKRL